MKVSVDWLQDYVVIKPPFEKVADRLTMAGLEVKRIETVARPKDCLFEVEVTSNRPDWLSHVGIAREIAAVENISLKLPECADVKGRPQPAGWKIQLKEAEACPYYTGVLIEGLSEQTVPDFIKQRLEVCGIRSINLIVDITNYVLLETGQPLHAFDADLLTGKEIKIRTPRDKETFTAIDGSQLTLHAKDLVIADAEKAVALAGVMGGRDSEVSAKTRNIFLESAFFHPRWVRQMSRRYGMSSESSYRFERRVDAEGVDRGRERAVYLIKKYAKPRSVSAAIRVGEKPAQACINLQLQSDEIIRRLGVPFKPHQISSIMTRLGFEVAQTSGGKAWKVKVPSYRSDVTSSIDLTEEVARIFGYDNIPETLPAREPIMHPVRPLRKLEEFTRSFFSGIGLMEAVTFSLISERGLNRETDLKDAVSIINPQNKELCWMRPFLYASLTEVIARNKNLGNQDVFIFEIANTNKKIKGKHPLEERQLGIAITGKWKSKNWLDSERNATFYDVKGFLISFFEALGMTRMITFSPQELLHGKPGRAEEMRLGNQVIGAFGELAPDRLAAWDLEEAVFVAELSLSKLAPVVPWIRPIRDLPRYPAIQRDLSVLVKEETPVQEIIDHLRSLKEPLIKEVEIFDFFRGGRIPEGYKNLGFRITYQSETKTLVSAETQALHSAIATQLAGKFQATFQSV